MSEHFWLAALVWLMTGSVFITAVEVFATPTCAGEKVLISLCAAFFVLMSAAAFDAMFSRPLPPEPR